MRTILQLGVMVLILLGAGNRVWGRMASCPHSPARRAAEASAFRLGGDAPPALPASGEAAMWGGEAAGAGNARPDSTPTMAGRVAGPVRGTAFMACPGSPPPSSPGATTNLAWMQVGPNVYAYVKQNPWTKFDPEGLANLDLTGSQDEAHSAFQSSDTHGNGVFTVGAHCQYTGYAHVSDGRSTGGTGGGPYVTPKQVLGFMKKAGWKEGMPILVLGCEAGGKGTAKGTIWTNCFASELAKLAGVPVGGPNKELYMNFPNGTPDTWQSRYNAFKKKWEADKLPDVNGPNKDNVKNGHVVWYDPDGNPIKDPAFPRKPWDNEYMRDHQVHMLMPQYVRDHMNKRNKIESSSKKQTTDKAPQRR